MANEGRITGRRSPDGTVYELVQFGTVRASYTIAQASQDRKLKAAIKRNGWEPIHGN